MNQGYMAVVLLVFVVVSVIIATAAVSMSVASLQAVSVFEQGTEALLLAESGADNALLRLLRDPTYVGETLTTTSGTSVVTVTGTNPQTVRSVGTVGRMKRTIEVVVNRDDGSVTVTSWEEVYN